MYLIHDTIIRGISLKVSLLSYPPPTEAQNYWGGGLLFTKTSIFSRHFKN